MSILEHITNSIKQTKVDPEPFPHMYIRNFFEENFYTKLLNSLPEKEKFVPINKTCSVGVKAEKNYGPNFFWILGGIPRPDDESDFIYYIIPSPIMAKNVTRRHQNWMNTPAKDGSKHNETTMRTVDIPPFKNRQENLQWDFSKYKNRWDIIEDLLN